MTPTDPQDELTPLPHLTPEEEAIYAWQTPVQGLGIAGQRRLKAATILVSRVGGLGGAVALQLAAAGVGRLILAHGGHVRPADLNRQILISHDAIGQPRMPVMVQRLKSLNPENISSGNAEGLVSQADAVIDCAPLFEERYALNAAAMKLGRPMIEAAVYELEFHLTTFLPGKTGCLRCLYPEQSSTWTRRFPVIGAVSGAAGALAALESIKLIAGFGELLAGKLLVADLRSWHMRKLLLHRLPQCPDCGKVQFNGNVP
jgi:molybdopterin-synthase adenylyltransferase